LTKETDPLPSRLDYQGEHPAKRRRAIQVTFVVRDSPLLCACGNTDSLQTKPTVVLLRLTLLESFGERRT